MKVLLQRVSRASVRIGGETTASIGRGLVVLLGVESGDTPADAAWYADRTAGLRIFEDEAGKMNISLLDIGGEALVVSQFTLAGSTRRGRRPSFEAAAPPDEALLLYELYAAELRALGVAVRTGRFQAMMEIELVNDGPVTFLLEARDPGPKKEG